MPFEVHLDYTEEDLIWYTRLYRRIRQKLLLALRVFFQIAFVLAGLFFLNRYIFWLRLGYNAVWALLYAVAVLGFFVYSLFQLRIRVKKTIKNRKENAGDVKAFFSEEQFECGAKNVQAQYSYDAIKEIWYSKSRATFYLFTGGKSAIIVPERCFTQGEPAAFGAFLAEKTGLEVKEIK